MATAPARPCPYPRCGRLVLGGGLCQRHRHARERERPTAAARGYDHQWAAKSRAWLQRFPWCGQRADGQLHAEHSRCVQRGTRTRAQCVDHIRSIRDGGARLNPSNLQSLCVRCNTAKG